MNKEDILEKVLNKGWFKNVDKNKATRLLGFSEVRKYRRGEFVYLVGDSQKYLFCILDGRIKISIVNQEGEEFVLTIWEDGYWFGESAILENATMPLEARSEADSTILAIPINAIDKATDNGAEIYKNIMQDMISRATELYSLVEMLLFKPLQVRVAARMLHLINLYGEESEIGVILPLQFSQADFARMSGGSRQRINKIFRQWASEGIVTKKGKNYIVHDVPGLQAAMEHTEEV